MRFVWRLLFYHQSASGLITTPENQPVQYFGNILPFALPEKSMVDWQNVSEILGI
jgi:hypothetical protein